MKLKNLLFLSLCYFAINAKNVSYSYDSAGNRVKREILFEKQSAPSRDISNPEYFSEVLDEKEIRIYPNPTEGLLKIEIKGYTDSDECGLSIFNMSGQQLQNMDVVGRTVAQAYNIIGKIDNVTYLDGMGALSGATGDCYSAAFTIGHYSFGPKLGFPTSTPKDLSKFTIWDFIL